MQEILFYLIISPFVIAVGIIVFGFLKATYKQFKGSPKKFFNNLLKIIGVILLIGLVFLLKPVWVGIDKGFEEVWENIRYTWIINIINNIFVSLILIFAFLAGIGMLLGVIFIVGYIPIALINLFLKKLTRRDKIPVFPFPPKLDFIEIMSLFFTVAIYVTLIFLISIYLIRPVMSL